MSSSFLSVMIRERVENKALPLREKEMESLKRDVIHALFAEAEDFTEINSLLDAYNSLLSRAISEGVFDSNEGLKQQIAVSNLSSQLYVSKTGHNVTVRTFMSMYSAMNSTHAIDIVKFVEQGQPRALRDICYLGCTLKEQLVNLFKNSGVIQRITSNLIYEHDFAFITNQSENKLAEWLELLKYLGLVKNFDSFVWECRKTSQLYDSRDITLHEETAKEYKLPPKHSVFSIVPTPNDADHYLANDCPFLNYTLNFRQDLKGIIDGQNNSDMASRRDSYLFQLKSEYEKATKEIEESSLSALGEVNEGILSLELSLKKLKSQQRLLLEKKEELLSELKAEFEESLNKLDEYCKQYEDTVLLESNKRSSLYQLNSVDDLDQLVTASDYKGMVDEAKALDSITDEASPVDSE